MVVCFFCLLRLWNTTGGRICFSSASSSFLASWGECVCAHRWTGLPEEHIWCSESAVVKILQQGLKTECDICVQVCPDVFHCALHTV